MSGTGAQLPSAARQKRNPEALDIRTLGRGADWHEDGWCFGQNDDVMFPESNAGQKQAAKVCELKCDVQTQCLDYALRADERFGVWGGTTERERERIRKRKGQV